jgi:hypothetical protein
MKPLSSLTPFAGETIYNRPRKSTQAPAAICGAANVGALATTIRSPAGLIADEVAERLSKPRIAELRCCRAIGGWAPRRLGLTPTVWRPATPRGRECKHGSR